MLIAKKLTVTSNIDELAYAVKKTVTEKINMVFGLH